MRTSKPSTCAAIWETRDSIPAFLPAPLTMVVSSLVIATFLAVQPDSVVLKDPEPDWRERAAAVKIPRKVRLLAPFDPIVRDRARALRLFGFDYRFEAFVPAARRQHGYYTLPILDGGELVGRVTLQRQAGSLSVLALHWERPPGAARRQRYGEALERLALFLSLSMTHSRVASID